MRYDEFLSRLFVDYRYFFGAAGYHCLQSLGTHHRPQAGTPGGAAVVGHDAGNQRQFLSGRSDTDYPGTFVLSHQDIFGFVRVFPPEVSRVFQFGFAVIEQQEYRLG